MKALTPPEKNDPDGRDQSLFYETLRTKLQAIVYQEISRTRGYLSPDEVEDVLQELLVSIWRIDLDRYDPRRGSLMGFLRKRVRWKIHDAMRAGVRRKAMREALIEPVQVRDPSEQYEANERQKTVRRALEKALVKSDPFAAYAIYAHDICGLPLKIVAKQLDISPTRVTRARQRGLKDLKRKLPAHDPKPSASLVRQKSRSSVTSRSSRARSITTERTVRVRPHPKQFRR